jgi:hypothetical protein
LLFGINQDDYYVNFSSSLDYAEYGFANFNIPADATIDGVEVSVEGKRDSVESDQKPRNLTVAIWNKSNSHSGVFTNSKIITLITDDSVVSVGGLSDKWDKTWAISDFSDADFKVKIGATTTPNHKNAYLDQVQVKVYYTLPIVITTLSVSPAAGTYGGTVDLSATLSPAVGGKMISFSLNGGSVGSSDTNSDGIASMNGVSLTGIDAGDYPEGIGASFAGDSSYGTSSGTGSLTVNGLDLTYTLTYTAASNGSITGIGSQLVNQGSDGTEVTAVAAVGYHFTDWSDGVATASRTDTNVLTDVNVTANFAADDTATKSGEETQLRYGSHRHDIGEVLGVFTSVYDNSSSVGNIQRQILELMVQILTLLQNSLY